ncbi:MAG: hypothetical protein K0U47_08835 [Epsilonproteobacteria bacterium]|nr:hypothetical protein [Campylobacterota bacterium]
MFYFILATIIVLLIGLLFFKIKRSQDPKTVLTTLALIGVVLFFTYISRTIFVHKPLFVIHLALLLISWYGLLRYLVKDKMHLWMILAPLSSTLFFFIMALFFREHA